MSGPSRRRRGRHQQQLSTPERLLVVGTVRQTGRAFEQAADVFGRLRRAMEALEQGDDETAAGLLTRDDLKAAGDALAAEGKRLAVVGDLIEKRAVGAISDALKDLVTGAGRG